MAGAARSRKAAGTSPAPKGKAVRAASPKGRGRAGGVAPQSPPPVAAAQPPPPLLPPAPPEPEVHAPVAQPAARQPLLPRFAAPLQSVSALLAVAAQVACMLPVAWPRGSAAHSLCTSWAERANAAAWFALFHAWLAFREQGHPWRVAAALLAYTVFGALVGWVYMLWAMHEARGNSARFWMGDRAPLPPPETPPPPVPEEGLVSPRRSSRGRKVSN